LGWDNFRIRRAVSPMNFWSVDVLVKSVREIKKLEGESSFLGRGLAKGVDYKSRVLMEGNIAYTTVNLEDF